MQRESSRSTGPTLFDIAMCEDSAPEAPAIPRELTSSAVDSLARTLARRASVLAFAVLRAACGASSSASLITYDLATSSWRTLQRSLSGDSIPFSGTWPRAGTMRSGTIYALPISVRRMAERECSSSHGTAIAWPTVVRADAGGARCYGRGESIAADRDHLEHTGRIGQRIASEGEGLACQGRWRETERSSTGVGLANARAERLKERNIASIDGGAAQSVSSDDRGCIEARAAESGLGRVLGGAADRLDFLGWPARPGEPQHAWEPPRTKAGVPHRAARLRTLGNIVVPWQAYVAGLIVREIEAAQAVTQQSNEEE